MICVGTPSTVNSSAPLSRRSRSSVENRLKSARVLEALRHLDLEPAVDAAAQELQSEVIHDQDRSDGEHAEYRDGAPFKA
jgi:hypothetical protein